MTPEELKAHRLANLERARAEKRRLAEERDRSEVLFEERRRAEALVSAPPEEPIERMPVVPFGDEAASILHSDANQTEDFAENLQISAENLTDTPIEPLDAFGRFLAAQDAETIELLGREELRVIWEVENKKALELKREATRKAARERAAQHAKGEAGIIPPEDVEAAELRRRNARKVTYTPDLPELGDVGLRINGRLLFHAQPVTITYGEWLSFREIEWRNKNAELDFEGKGRLHHLRRSGAIGGLSVNLAGQRV